MSNLNNVYVSCPALMSDGRGNVTDWSSHNELFKTMKGNTETSYDFRAKLQASGLRDLEQGVRFNMCQKDPAGEVVLGKIALNVNTSGSFLDAFAPLSKNSFFNKDRQLVSTNPASAPTVAVPAPTTSVAVPMPTVAPIAPTTMAPTTMAPEMVPTTSMTA